MGRHRLSPEAIEAHRARVVRAAESLFAAHGYEGVTLRALAAALGRSHTAVYRYFDGKADIFEAARIAAYDRFAEAQEQVVREIPEPRARLAGLGSAYVRFAREEPDAYRLMFELKPPGGEASPEMRAAEQRGWTPLREAIGSAVGADLLRGDAEVLAHLFWAALHGIVSLELADKLSHGLDLDDLEAPMKRLLFEGGHRLAES